MSKFAALHIIFVVLFEPSIVSSQNVDCIPRPPPFPDFIGAFVRSYHHNKYLSDWKDLQIQQRNPPYECNCTVAFVDSFLEFNDGCDLEVPDCPTTTTAEPTTTIPTTTAQLTTTSEPTSTSKSVSTSTADSTVSLKSTASSTETVPTTKSSTTPNLTTSVVTPVRVPDNDSTRSTTWTSTISQGAAETTLPGVTVQVPVDSVVDRENDNNIRNVIIASLCGGLLALIIVVTTLCVLRKKCWPVSHSTVDIKAEKLARQRSDCQPLPDNSHDTFSNPPTPSTKGPVNGRLTNGHSNPGFTWQDSDRTSVTSNNYVNSKNLLLGAAASEDFDYSTLKAMELPHAVQRSGFGESSTDNTLPKKRSKKKKRPSKYEKKMDANHNSRGSIGKNSIGNRSNDSKDESMGKGSIKSKTSVKSKESQKGKSNSLPPASVMMSSDLMKFSKDAEDDILDGTNDHFFAYSNILAYNASLTPSVPSRDIIAPPTEFQDNRRRDSPFNSNDRRRTEDPPTAI